MPWIPNTQIAASGGALSLIEEIILSIAGTTIDFQNIPATYRVLVIYIYARGDTAATFVNLDLRFNADAGTNYHREFLAGTGSSSTASQAGSDTEMQIGEISAANAPASYFAAGSGHIPYYANTVGFKAIYAETFDSRGTAATTQIRMMAGGLWLSTDVINRVQLIVAAGNFVADSRATLYGIT